MKKNLKQRHYIAFLLLLSILIISVSSCSFFPIIQKQAKPQPQPQPPQPKIIPVTIIKGVVTNQQHGNVLKIFMSNGDTIYTDQTGKFERQFNHDGSDIEPYLVFDKNDTELEADILEIGNNEWRITLKPQVSPEIVPQNESSPLTNIESSPLTNDERVVWPTPNQLDPEPEEDITYDITGWVLNIKNQKPVKQAKVILRYSDKQALTQRNGSFVIRNLTNDWLNPDEIIIKYKNKTLKFDNSKNNNNEPVFYVTLPEEKTAFLFTVKYHKNNEPVPEAIVKIELSGQADEDIETNYRGIKRLRVKKGITPKPVKVIVNGQSKLFDVEQEGTNFFIFIYDQGVCNQINYRFLNNSPSANNDNRDYMILRDDGSIYAYNFTEKQVKWTLSNNNFGQDFQPKYLRMDDTSKYFYILDRFKHIIQIRNKENHKHKMFIDIPKKRINEDLFGFNETRDTLLEEPDIIIGLPFEDTKEISMLSLNVQNEFKDCISYPLPDKPVKFTSSLAIYRDLYAYIGLLINDQPLILKIDIKNKETERVEMHEKVRKIIIHDQKVLVISNNDVALFNYNLTKKLHQWQPGNMSQLFFHFVDYKGNYYWGGLVKKRMGHNWNVYSFKGKRSFRSAREQPDISIITFNYQPHAGILTTKDSLYAVFIHGKDLSCFIKAVTGTEQWKLNKHFSLTEECSRLNVFPSYKGGGLFVIELMDRTTRVYSVDSNGFNELSITQ